MDKKYITVVIEYEEGDKFPMKLTQAFADDEMIEGVRITAVSLEDEFKRIEGLEEQLD